MRVLAERDRRARVAEQRADGGAQLVGLRERALPLLVDVARGVVERLDHALERDVGPRLMGVPGEQEPVADAEHRVVARERVGAAAQVLRRERAGRGRLGAAHSCDRTAQRSGNIGRKSVVRRYAAPDDPPVPILSPIVRSTIFTWR